jgi:hypothetical protein
MLASILGIAMLSASARATPILTDADLGLSAAAVVIADGTRIQKTSTTAGLISANLNNATDSTTATASANYGVLKVGAHGTRTNVPSATGQNVGEGYAGFGDKLTIATSEYPDGWVLETVLHFSLTYRLTARNPNDTLAFPSRMTGGANAVLDATAYVTAETYGEPLNYYEYYTAKLESGVGVSYSRTNVDADGSSSDTLAHSLMNVSVRFSNNVPFDVAFILQAHGMAHTMATPGVESFDADAAHSGYWAGIDTPTANGVPIDNYTITSASGTDYSRSMVPASVPEPATALTLLIGAAGLASVRARRRTAARE